ncbi:IS3 family transposase [Paenibacillus sp. Marseille-Q9583]
MAKKGQTFTKYSEELKNEAVRLHLEEHMSYSQILEKLDIKSDAQLVRWILKFKSGETFEDRRGKGGRKHFDSKDEEIAYLKAQVEYLKKLNPKDSKLYLEKPKNLEDAEHLVKEYILYYNKERFQKKLGDLSPEEYRNQIAA